MSKYKNISSKYIVAKVYRDLGLEDPNYEVDIIEWIGEALDFIGASSDLVSDIIELEVDSFKAPLPEHFVVFEQVKYFDNEQQKWSLLEYNPKTFFGHTEDSENLTIRTDESYSLNPNYIITSFESGKLLVSYKRLALDEDGYPLVPDNQYFKDALFWYCFRQLIMRGYRPKANEIGYEFADAKWRFYCSGARNQSVFPDINAYERFSQVWKGLVPIQSFVERNFDNSSFKQINIETVDASNLITRPLTVEKPNNDE